MSDNGESTLVLVTGPMRSGTSAVAQMVHRMGFVAAQSMTPPHPPRWHQDWEDAEALQALLAIGLDRKRFRAWFGDYLDRRFRAVQRLRDLGETWARGVCCKSPLYAPFLDDIQEACVATGVQLRVLVCARVPAESDESLRRVLAPLPARMADTLTERQEAIRDDLSRHRTGESRGYHIDFALLLERPDVVASNVADYLGVDAASAGDCIEPRARAGGG